MPILYQATFLLPLKEVVRKVVIDDAGVALPELEAALVHIGLYLVELACQQGQCQIDLLQGAFRLLEEPLRILQGRPLGPGIQYPGVHQHRQDTVQVVLE